MFNYVCNNYDIKCEHLKDVQRVTHERNYVKYNIIIS